jgi:hypothetical protein
VSVYAQQTERGLWTNLELKKKLGKNISVSFDEEYRQKDRIGMTDRFMTTIDASWKPLDFLKGGASYTLINKYSADETEPWSVRHRWGIYLTGLAEWNRWEFSWRQKFQSTYQVGAITSEHVSNPTNLLRSKLVASYNIKGHPINPYVSVELMYTLNEPDGDISVGSVGKFTECRMACGLEYKISKKLSASAGYLFSSGTDWDTYVDGNTIGGFYENTNEHVLTFGLSVTL